MISLFISFSTSNDQSLPAKFIIDEIACSVIYQDKLYFSCFFCYERICMCYGIGTLVREENTGHPYYGDLENENFT
jgi:hypothetical protein